MLLLKEIPPLTGFLDYKKYLRKVIDLNRPHVSALKSKLAQAADCHLTYFSNILNGETHLSMEQAEELGAELFKDDDDIDCFIELVAFARAGTTALKRRLEKKILARMESKQNLKRRLKTLVKESSPEIEQEYFSSWIYAAIHVCLGIPSLRNANALAKYLGVSPEPVQKALDFLEAAGLASITKAGQYVATDVAIHMGKDSPLLRQHLRNVNTACALQSERGFKNDSHFNYGVFAAISERDFVLLKELFVKATEDTVKVLRSSVDEKLCLINIQLTNF